MGGTNNDVAGAVAIYDPNGPAAIIAFIAYGIVAVALWWRYYRVPRPRAKYMRPTCIGATFMSLGYLIRFTRRNGINAWSWLFETLFILLSPVLFLAQDDVLLPRLARFLSAEECLPFPPRALVIVFVTGDILTVLAQLAGTALTITFGELVSIGVKTVTAGLWVQLAFFSIFVAIYIVFGKRLRYRGDFSIIAAKPRFQRWQGLYGAIGASCICLAIRSIYRVAEFTAGAGSALGQSEVAFYLLDALPLYLNVITFFVVWPPHCLDHEFQSLEMANMHRVGKA